MNPNSRGLCCEVRQPFMVFRDKNLLIKRKTCRSCLRKNKYYLSLLGVDIASLKCLFPHPLSLSPSHTQPLTNTHNHWHTHTSLSTSLMFRFDVIAGSIPLALIRLSPLAPPSSDHRFYLCLLICLVCLYVFVLLILSFMIMMRRLSLVGNKSLCSHVVKNTRIMILCYNMTSGTRADGIVCIGENAIDIHRMHIPFYGGCMEKEKRRLPALRIFGRAARGLAGAAGRRLGVIWNTFWTRSEHRLRADSGQCSGGSIVFEDRRTDGKVDKDL